MVLITSLVTGLFAAMLRSVFAVITVAFLLTLAFAVAAIAYGTSLLVFLLAVGGFNAGLILFAIGHIVHASASSSAQ